MNDTEVAYVNTVYVKTAGPEPYEYYFAVGYYLYRSGLKVGKILKLCIQSGSDAVAVAAKIISDEKEILVTSVFFRNNIVCFETASPYNGELEPYEDDE